MKGVLYLLRFFPKDVVKKIHSHLMLIERFLIPLKTKPNTCDVFLSGDRVSRKTGPLCVQSIYITQLSGDTSIVNIAFKSTNNIFKEWLLHWENVMHMYYQEKGIKKKRCNTIRNNTLFCTFKESSYYGDSDVNITDWNNSKRCKAMHWNNLYVGRIVFGGKLTVLGIGWAHEEAKMHVSLSL
jgi:hypothetical protein